MDVLTFFVNGKKITDANPDPEDTLLQYLRRKLLLPGTKEGCGHGGCGSCTVMVSKYDVISQKIMVNACIFPICATHGLAITTVEGVGSPNTGLHKIQQSLVDKHGLQCGFCTPGFVMSAFTLLRNNPQPSRDEFEQALEGNLCRCTGYRGIISAFDTFTKEGCSMGEYCCKNTKGRTSLNQDDQKQPDSNTDTQVPIFPPELQLNPDSYSSTVKFKGQKYTWISPSSLQELVQLKHDYCRSPVIMGNTTTALQLKQGQFSSSPVLLYVCNVSELKTTLPTDQGIQFGAALTLNDVKTYIQTIRNGKQDQKFAHLDSILDMIRYYGSDQIRNVATLSGSILSGRSNSDVTTLLLALNTSVIINSDLVKKQLNVTGVHDGNTELVELVSKDFQRKLEKYEMLSFGTEQGISQTIYKEAVRCEEPITFVCRPCLEKDNVLDQNVPYPDDAPPVLEISLPQPTDAATIIYDEPPELEISVVGDPFKRNGQLMSIHAFIEKNGKSKQLPLVFCLMSRRTKEDYVVVLRALLRKLGHVDVQGFVLDYEQAAWLAIREVFPGKEVKGCAFHWSQAVWRRVQQVELAETYRKRQGMHSFVRMLLSIQFLPADHIRRAFDGLAARASTAETIELVGYVRRQWVEGTTFRPCDWSVFQQTIRTNNDVEGWHHRLNGKAGASCLSFYRLVPLLHREAEIVKVAVETGDLDRGSSVRSARLDKSLTDCWERYSSGEWKVSRFLQAVGNLYSVRC